MQCEWQAGEPRKFTFQANVDMHGWPVRDPRMQGSVS